MDKVRELRLLLNRKPVGSRNERRRYILGRLLEIHQQYLYTFDNRVEDPFLLRYVLTHALYPKGRIERRETADSALCFAFGYSPMDTTYWVLNYVDDKRIRWWKRTVRMQSIFGDIDPVFPYYGRRLFRVLRSWPRKHMVDVIRFLLKMGADPTLIDLNYIIKNNYRNWALFKTNFMYTIMKLVRNRAEEIRRERGEGERENVNHIPDLE